MNESSAFSQFVGMTRDVTRTVGKRFAAVTVLAIVAGAAEGVGLLSLVPLLDLLGVTGAGGGASSIGRALGTRVGLPGALALYVVLIAAACLIIRARTIAGAALTADYVETLRSRLHAAALAMDWTVSSRIRQADLNHVIVGEVGRCGFAVDLTTRLIASLTPIPALLAAAFLISPLFSLAILCLVALAAPATLPLNRRAHALGAALAESSRATHAEIADQTTGLRVVKSFALEATCEATFRALALGERDRRMEQTRASATARAVQRTTVAVAAAFAVWVGVGPLGLAVSETLVLLALFARSTAAAMGTQEGWRLIVQQLPVHAHVMASLETWRRAAEAPRAAAAPIPRRALTLAGVRHIHPGREGARPALDGVDAEIPALAVTAVIGPSGAGKSTLVDLATGLVAPTEGAVMIDGLPLDGALRAAWRRRVGHMPQDPFLFHRSLRDNLLLVRPDADDAMLRRALSDAAADELVGRLPLGLDTVVGDRGAALSGGERQRIALARALSREPDLLALDEATAALDAETEGLIVETLRRMRGRTTVLVVAHRPSLARIADHVLLLEEGRLLAAGPWERVREIAGERLEALGMFE